MFKKDKIIKIIEMAFPWFLASQVIIDLLTTVFVHVLKFPISFGMIVRFVFIIAAVIYIAFRNNKLSKILLFSLLAFFAIQFCYFYLTLPKFSVFSNARYYLRTLYYPIVVLFLWTYRDKLDTDRIFKIVEFNVALIAIVFIISMLTRTDFFMYKVAKIGTSAWFSSGNEISSIVSLLSLTMLYCFLKKPNLTYFLVLIASMFIMAIMGTKTAFFTLIIYMILTIMCLLIMSVKDKKKIIYLLIIILMALLLGLNYKKLPAQKNINTIYDIQEDIVEKSKYSDDDEEIPEKIVSSRYVNSSYDDKNDYIGSINLLMRIDDNGSRVINISGYFYPLFFDVSHPKYIEKKLVFYNDNLSFEIPLTDTYNRYVRGYYEEEYNSDFSGILGEFNADGVNFGEKYNIKMEILIDGLKKDYDVIDSIVLNGNSEALKIVDDKLVINSDKISVQSLEEECSVPRIKIPLLSGRLERIVRFARCEVNLGTKGFLFGTGNIKNYINSNGFEMDVVEVFVTSGIVGFIIYFFVTILCFIRILIGLIRCPKNILKDNNFLLLLSILIGFAASFVAGHVIHTPGPAIYMALLLIISDKKLYVSKDGCDNE